MPRKTEQVVVRTIYGSMEFESHEAVEKFRKIIASWEGFTPQTKPMSGFEAVQYHLAYEVGGFTEVYALMRHEQMKAYMHEHAYRIRQERKIREAEIRREREYQFAQEEMMGPFAVEPHLREV